MKKNNILIIVLCLIFCKNLQSQNATITVKNKSDRYMYKKVMKGPEKKAILYKTDSIAPKGTLVFDIAETGLYFTKTRAILYDKKYPEKNDTIYRQDSQDRPMQIISDKKGGYKHEKTTTNNLLILTHYSNKGKRKKRIPLLKTIFHKFIKLGFVEN